MIHRLTKPCKSAREPHTRAAPGSESPQARARRGPRDHSLRLARPGCGENCGTAQGGRRWGGCGRRAMATLADLQATDGRGWSTTSPDYEEFGDIPEVPEVHEDIPVFSHESTPPARGWDGMNCSAARPQPGPGCAESMPGAAEGGAKSQGPARPSQRTGAVGAGHFRCPPAPAAWQEHTGKGGPAMAAACSEPDRVVEELLDLLLFAAGAGSAYLRQGLLLRLEDKSLKTQRAAAAVCASLRGQTQAPGSSSPQRGVLQEGAGRPGLLDASDQHQELQRAPLGVRPPAIDGDRSPAIDGSLSVTHQSAAPAMIAGAAELQAKLGGRFRCPPPPAAWLQRAYAEATGDHVEGQRMVKDTVLHGPVEAPLSGTAKGPPAPDQQHSTGVRQNRITASVARGQVVTISSDLSKHVEQSIRLSVSSDDEYDDVDEGDHLNANTHSRLLASWAEKEISNAPGAYAAGPADGASPQGIASPSAVLQARGGSASWLAKGLANRPTHISTDQNSSSYSSTLSQQVAMLHAQAPPAGQIVKESRCKTPQQRSVVQENVRTFNSIQLGALSSSSPVAGAPVAVPRYGSVHQTFSHLNVSPARSSWLHGVGGISEQDSQRQSWRR